MATFRVGQRVRIIGGRLNMYVGVEAIIKSNLRLANDGRGRLWYGHELEMIGVGELDFLPVYSPKYLAPIQPEHNQTIPWSECLWQPNRTDETA